MAANLHVSGGQKTALEVFKTAFSAVAEITRQEARAYFPSPGRTETASSD